MTEVATAGVADRVTTPLPYGEGPADQTDTLSSPSQTAKRRGGVLGRWGGRGNSSVHVTPLNPSNVIQSQSPQRPSKGGDASEATRTEFYAPGLGHGVIVTDGLGSMFCKVVANLP